MSRPRIAVDTREQLPYEFREAKMVRKTLPEGDYGVSGDRLGLVIERKSIDDLFGSITSDLARFERELLRMRAYEFKVLLIEGMQSTVALGTRRSRASGPKVLDHVFRLCLQYGVSPIFCNGRLAAQDTAWRLLKARHEIRNARV